MRKKQLISKDSEYFRDNEEPIKLEFCKNDGIACKLQMEFMNSKLLLARKFSDKKEFPRALEVIKVAYESTFELKQEQCQICADLFRDTILKTLVHLIGDLKDITKGLFGNKNYLFDLNAAEKLLTELKSGKDI